MNISILDVTFIIVTYKSEKVIKNCLDSLPKESKKIIIENSKNQNLKKELLSNYDNIEVIISENVGMGASNNIGIEISETKYAYVINPDTFLKNDTMSNVIETLKSIDDFTILSPLNSNNNYPNYKIYNNQTKNDSKVLDVDEVDGFSMLLNKSKFKNMNYFDENFFLYLENSDLCKRVKNSGGKIFIFKNSLIDHLGASSTSISSNKDFEYLRNWHWMWSKFYFNKKHYGFLAAILKTLSNLFSSIIKFLYYLIIFNNYKRKIYQMRLSGLINSMIGKKSFYRLKT